MSNSYFQIDPRVPFAWLNPTTLRFGLDTQKAVVSEISAAAQPVLRALCDGVTRVRLTRVANRSGMSTQQLNTVLDALQPVLLQLPWPCTPLRRHGPVQASRIRATQVLQLVGDCGVDRDSWLHRAVAEALSWHGFTLLHDDTVAVHSDVVLLSRYLPSPALVDRYLSQGTNVTPVVFSDGGVRIGPRLNVAKRCCLTCVSEMEQRRDPDWALLAVQLMGQPSPVETPESVRAIGQLLPMLNTGDTPRQLFLPVTNRGVTELPDIRTVARCVSCHSAETRAESRAAAEQSAAEPTSSRAAA